MQAPHLCVLWVLHKLDEDLGQIEGLMEEVGELILRAFARMVR